MCRNMSVRTSSGKRLLRGVVGAFVISPFALYIAGLGAKIEFLKNFFGSDWTVFRSIFGVGLMIGFAIGYQLISRSDEGKSETKSSDF